PGTQWAKRPLSRSRQPPATHESSWPLLSGLEDDFDHSKRYRRSEADDRFVCAKKPQLLDGVDRDDGALLDATKVHSPRIDRYGSLAAQEGPAAQRLDPDLAHPTNRK